MKTAKVKSLPTTDFKIDPGLNIISKGFIAAGLSNILGILLFSKVFTNQELSLQFPEVFSQFGMVVIMLWGLAYIACYRMWPKLGALALVFSLEKLLYVLSWIYWLSNHSNELPGLLTSDPLTGIFYVVYGINDFLFMVLFIWAFRLASKEISR